MWYLVDDDIYQPVVGVLWRYRFLRIVKTVAPTPRANDCVKIPPQDLNLNGSPARSPRTSTTSDCGVAVGISFLIVHGGGPERLKQGIALLEALRAWGRMVRRIHLLVRIRRSR